MSSSAGILHSDVENVKFSCALRAPDCCVCLGFPYAKDWRKASERGHYGAFA